MDLDDAIRVVCIVSVLVNLPVIDLLDNNIRTYFSFTSVSANDTSLICN